MNKTNNQELEKKELLKKIRKLCGRAKLPAGQTVLSLLGREPAPKIKKTTKI